MTSVPRLALAGATAVALTAGVAALSRVPYDAASETDALLRLAWRTRGVRVEECRRLTPEELADVPQHMRREEVCEGRTLPYHLEVRVDGRLRLDRVVHASGAREDRPLYVLDDIPLAPGAHAVDIAFVRQGEVPAEDTLQVATPARLELQTVIDLAPGAIALVTYDPDGRRLVLLSLSLLLDPS